MTKPDETYFQSIPWCANVIKEPNFVVTPTISRQYKESTEDALFAETLKTDDTIRACLSLYKRPAPGVVLIDEVRTLLSLGYRLNGYPNLCHGGIVATIMDEAMGTLLTVNKALEHATLVTAYLQVTYLKPVATPQSVLVTARFKQIKGRKHFIEATVENGAGFILAKAEALFVSLAKPKARL